jgi:integrase/recombinase XerD
MSRVLADAALEGLRSRFQQKTVRPTAVAPDAPETRSFVLRRLDPPTPPSLPLAPLVAEYSSTCGATWGPVTRRKHRDDYQRFTTWLEATGRPTTTAALDFATLVAFVTDLRARPGMRGVWRGTGDAAVRSTRSSSARTLSANTVNAYVRPLRSLCLWLVDEGLLARDPFRRIRRRSAGNPLLPTEDTPTKSATLADLRTLERGCAGEAPVDLRDRAIVAILVTTAARNSSVRLLALDDLDFERGFLRFRRAKGGKTLEIALHPNARQALAAYLADGRPALVGAVSVIGADQGVLFPSLDGDRTRPLTMNALSHMLTRRYHAGGGTLPYFGSHRIRHATATLLSNHGMGLGELARYLGHSSTDVTRRYAIQTSETLGRQAADALARAGLGGQ